MMALVIVVTTALALFASNDKQRIVFSDSCDYVEINNVYNTNEETTEHTLRMTQYIWWEWRDRILLPVLDPITKQETGDRCSTAGHPNAGRTRNTDNFQRLNGLMGQH